VCERERERERKREREREMSGKMDELKDSNYFNQNYFN